MNPRRVIQITVATNTEKGGEFRERLYAVAHDGTVWRLDDRDLASGRGIRKTPAKKSSGWVRLLPLPGMVDADADKPTGAVTPPQDRTPSSQNANATSGAVSRAEDRTT